MKKHSENASAPIPFKAEILPRARVRYVGFESIEGGRRLRFSVKAIGHESVEITFDVSDETITGTSGITIQDAAPMAYEKLVELLSEAGTLDFLESKQLSLTDTDITQYRSRHVDSQSRSHSWRDGRRAA